jgi:hypothetical protein
MATSWVIRLFRDNGDTSPIIVKISRKENGHDLDLDLLATDGDAAFIGKGEALRRAPCSITYLTAVRQRNLKKLQAKTYEGSDDDWSAILSYTLISKQQSSIGATQKKNLDVLCSIAGKKNCHTLSIAFRNNIEGIIQRLGVIDLPETQDTDDVDLFGWTLQVIEQRDKLEEEAASQKEKAKAEQETEARLQKQLSDLVEAKAEHEKQLLSKFSALLNEKKLKIRNMQRILQTAQVDQKKLKELEPVLEMEDKPQTRHGTKHRIDNAPEEDDDDDDESDGFETMAVDNAADNEDLPDSPDSRRSETPSTDTVSEGGDGLDAPPSPAPRKTRSTDKDGERRPSSPLPPPRELPFQKKTGPIGKAVGDKKRASKSPEHALVPDDDEETASEDDEL